MSVQNFSSLAGLEVPEKFMVGWVVWGGVGSKWVLCLTQRSCFWVALSWVELRWVLTIWHAPCVCLPILDFSEFSFTMFSGWMPVRYWCNGWFTPLLYTLSDAGQHGITVKSGSVRPQPPVLPQPSAHPAGPPADARSRLLGWAQLRCASRWRRKKEWESFGIMCKV